VTNLWQPSAILTDTDHSAYIFRLTEVRPAETPKDVSEVASFVEADLLKDSTLRVAHTTAVSFLDQARKASFADAAKAAGKTVITTEHFDSRQSVVPGFDLDQTSTQLFINECFRLLNQPSKDGSRMMATIDLPQAGKVVAVQIEDVRPVWNDESVAAIQAQVNNQAWASAAQMLQAEWFDYESAKTRTNYQPSR
jgi:hypothetical protein